MRALLDVNVLLALFDRDHVLHERARQWFEQEIRQGWASCATTQNGFVRILSQPGYPKPVSTWQALRLLTGATAAGYHEYWPGEVSILDDTIFDRSRIHGLAVHHGGRFVTFDRTIALAAVRLARPDNLVVL